MCKNGTSSSVNQMDEFSQLCFPPAGIHVGYLLNHEVHSLHLHLPSPVLSANLSTRPHRRPRNRIRARRVHCINIIHNTRRIGRIRAWKAYKSATGSALGAAACDGNLHTRRIDLSARIYVRGMQCDDLVADDVVAWSERRGNIEGIERCRIGL